MCDGLPVEASRGGECASGRVLWLEGEAAAVRGKALLRGRASAAEGSARETRMGQVS